MFMPLLFFTNVMETLLPRYIHNFLCITSSYLQKNLWLLTHSLSISPQMGVLGVFTPDNGEEEGA